MRASDVESAWSDWEQHALIAIGYDPSLRDDEATWQAFLAMMDERGEEGLRSLYGSMGVRDEVMQALHALADQQMVALKGIFGTGVGYYTQAVTAGFLVGLMAAHKAGEYEPGGKA
jgi:hypothetical protein